MKHLVKTSTIALLSAALLSSVAAAQTSGSGSGNTGSTSVGSSMSGNSGMPHSNTGSNSSHSGATSTSDWDSHNTYWRGQYSTRPYYNKSRDYSTMEPAYRYGTDLYSKNPGKRYEDLDQSQISSGWAQSRGNSTLGWSDAEKATRDAYNRMYNNRGTTGAGNNAPNSSGSTNH